MRYSRAVCSLLLTIGLHGVDRVATAASVTGITYDITGGDFGSLMAGTLDGPITGVSITWSAPGGSVSTPISCAAYSGCGRLDWVITGPSAMTTFFNYADAVRISPNYFYAGRGVFSPFFYRVRATSGVGGGHIGFSANPTVSALTFSVGNEVRLPTPTPTPTPPTATPTTAVGEFQINTYTTNIQRFPSVAVDADGDFVVTWDSEGSPGSDTDLGSIQGQRYDSSGSAVGAQFQVNTYTTSFQTGSSIAVDSDGDFVVVWNSNGSSGSDFSYISIQGRRYDGSGNAIGAEFQVNTYTTSNQAGASIAIDAGGDFVVVWQSLGSLGSDSSNYSIQGQRYDAGGSVVGSEFQVNTHTTNYQIWPSIAVDTDGDFVVAWTSDAASGSDTDNFSIQGQRYDASGSEIGAEFQVNTYTTSSQNLPSVAADADGDFVVVWQSLGSAGSDNSADSIQGQRYVVPEPSEYWMLGTGIAFLAAVGRRRIKA